MFAIDGQGSTPFMVAIATGQKEILRIMLDSAMKILDVTGQNASIVLWALENDHVTLLQVCYHENHPMMTISVWLPVVITCACFIVGNMGS